MGLIPTNASAMRICFNTWVYASFPVWLPARSLDDTIATLSAVGYDGIELGAAAPHGFPDYLDATRRAAIRELLSRHDMEVASICPAVGGGPGYNPASPDAPERAAAAHYLGGCIELAADLACPSVIYLAGHRRLGQSRADAWNRSAEVLQGSAEIAARHGVLLVVEPTPLDSNLVEHGGDALQLIRDAGVDGSVVATMLDTAHVMGKGGELRDAAREVAGHLGHVHLAEANRDAPGTQTDLTPFLEELLAIGYSGWLSMEVGFNRREQNPDALAALSLSNVRAALARARRPV